MESAAERAEGEQQPVAPQVEAVSQPVSAARAGHDPEGGGRAGREQERATDCAGAGEAGAPGAAGQPAPGAARRLPQAASFRAGAPGRAAVLADLVGGGARGEGAGQAGQRRQPASQPATATASHSQRRSIAESASRKAQPAERGTAGGGGGGAPAAAAGGGAGPQARSFTPHVPPADALAAYAAGTEGAATVAAGATLKALPVPVSAAHPASTLPTSPEAAAAGAASGLLASPLCLGPELEELPVRPNQAWLEWWTGARETAYRTLLLAPRKTYKEIAEASGVGEDALRDWRRHPAWRWRVMAETTARHEEFREILLLADEAAVEALPVLVAADGRTALEYLDRREVLVRRPEQVEAQVKHAHLHILVEADGHRFSPEDCRMILANNADRLPAPS